MAGYKYITAILPQNKNFNLLIEYVLYHSKYILLYYTCTEIHLYKSNSDSSDFE